MHTKSHPQNSKIAQAVVDVCPRPSISPRRPWCQGHGDILGRGRTFTTAHDMGRRLSNASPTPWSRVQITVVFVGGNLAGTGIPEYSGDSGVIRDPEVQPKGGSCKKIPPKKKESWGILAGTKNRDQEMDIPETGKCNLALDTFLQTSYGL